jgi:hypothetical protein
MALAQRIINGNRVTRTVAGTPAVTRTITSPDGLTLVRQLVSTTRQINLAGNVKRTIGLLVTAGDPGPAGPAGATGPAGPAGASNLAAIYAAIGGI